jgi:peptide/nickel transport system substrate-binding protein
VCRSAQQKNGWSGLNFGRYCNTEYDDLFQQSATEVDPEKRRALFVKMNDVLIADAAVIPLVHWADTSGIAADLEGYNATPWDSETWNIAEWHRRP